MVTIDVWSDEFDNFRPLSRGLFFNCLLSFALPFVSE